MQVKVEMVSSCVHVGCQVSGGVRCHQGGLGIPGLLPQVQDKQSDERHVLIPGKIGASRRFEKVWGSLKGQVYPLGDDAPPLPCPGSPE